MSSISFFFFGHTAQHVECPRPGTEPKPPALEAQSLYHWITREIACPQLLGSIFILHFLKELIFFYFKLISFNCSLNHNYFNLCWHINSNFINFHCSLNILVIYQLCDFLKKLLLEYSWFTLLCKFLLYYKVNQLYIYILSFFKKTLFPYRPLQSMCDFYF